MNRPRTYRASAVVLRQRELGEADRILVLYTRERGKLSAVAKGVRRTRSKLAGSLQLFAHLQLHLAVGRSLAVVTQARAADTFRGLRGELAQYIHACYVVELVDAVSEEGLADPEVFDLLVGTLAALNAGGEPTTLVRSFELKLLTRLGYGPELDSCACCGTQMRGNAPGFSVSEGGVVCAACLSATGQAAPLSASAGRALRELRRLTTQELAGKRLNEQTNRELARLMRAYVPFHIGRELRSATFLEDSAKS